jgi:hypothetical protein
MNRVSTYRDELPVCRLAGIKPLKRNYAMMKIQKIFIISFSLLLISVTSYTQDKTDL